KNGLKADTLYMVPNGEKKVPERIRQRADRDVAVDYDELDELVDERKLSGFVSQSVSSVKNREPGPPPDTSSPLQRSLYERCERCTPTFVTL
ncbi:MAG TPA: hypothetical protein PK969_10935, partial [Treponemataceae bacterium]|nr:hypothetical protein [Treponemataceae bacterium]